MDLPWSGHYLEGFAAADIVPDKVCACGEVLPSWVGLRAHFLTFMSEDELSRMDWFEMSVRQKKWIAAREST